MTTSDIARIVNLLGQPDSVLSSQNFQIGDIPNLMSGLLKQERFQVALDIFANHRAILAQTEEEVVALGYAMLCCEKLQQHNQLQVLGSALKALEANHPYVLKTEQFYGITL